MGGFERDQQVDMIRHTTDSMRESIETFGDPAEVGVKFGAPRGGDHRFPVFRREDEVVMKGGVGRGHDVRWLAPLPGGGIRGAQVPVVSLRSSTGYRMRCLRHQETASTDRCLKCVRFRGTPVAGHSENIPEG